MSRTTPTPDDLTGPPPTPAELRSEVEQARRELADAIDALTTRVSPSYQASQLARNTRQAAQDVGGLFSGDGLPAHDERRARNAKILLGVAAAGAVTVAFLVVKAFRR
ncbi:uncharacterized protein DUF3618 [Isoptericola jiangsuensis]|uniref:Uncharacterized protein DUF3618 n=1 Tax=Isoptericola jiangsuensis TaxID=548579 RepID=A0A2A9EU81_9MICO|nr:DUF3618 domain-containing protein [Isoptericola jiangsuensis]PFG41850.1 uncharacterized protein DUF3618 [Isoptericola jiangsuensis]